MESRRVDARRVRRTAQPSSTRVETPNSVFRTVPEKTAASMEGRTPCASRSVSPQRTEPTVAAPTRVAQHKSIPIVDELRAGLAQQISCPEANQLVAIRSEASAQIVVYLQEFSVALTSNEELMRMCHRPDEAHATDRDRMMDILSQHVNAERAVAHWYETYPYGAWTIAELVWVGLIITKFGVYHMMLWRHRASGWVAGVAAGRGVDRVGAGIGRVGRWAGGRAHVARACPHVRLSLCRWGARQLARSRKLRTCRKMIPRRAAGVGKHMPETCSPDSSPPDVPRQRSREHA